MFGKLRKALISILAPGIEESKKDEIKFNIGNNNSFKLDLKSLKESEAMQRQIASIRSEEKRAI